MYIDWYTQYLKVNQIYVIKNLSTQNIKFVDSKYQNYRLQKMYWKLNR